MITPLHSDSGTKCDPCAIRQRRIADRSRRRRKRRRYQMIGIGAGALLLLIVIAILIRNWLAAEMSVPIERVRIAEVTRGPFVRDISAQGTVVRP